MKFTKMCGLGNDYIFVDCFCGDGSPDSRRTWRSCWLAISA